MGVTIIDNTQVINNATWKVQPDIITSESGIVKENGTIHYIGGKLKYHANGVIKELGLGTEPAVPVITALFSLPLTSTNVGDRYLVVISEFGVIIDIDFFEWNGVDFDTTPVSIGQKIEDLSLGKTYRWSGTALVEFGSQKALQDLSLSRKTNNYTLVAADNGKAIEMNKATANTLTVPSGVFTAGQQVLITQYGAGQTTIVGSGVTLRSDGGKLKINAQYSMATILFISATEAYVSGNLAL